MLKREGADADCMGRFYQVIVQAVLLCGADSWTITKRNMKRVQSFHNRVIRHIAGKHTCKKGGTGNTQIMMNCSKKPKCCQLKNTLKEDEER